MDTPSLDGPLKIVCDPKTSVLGDHVSERTIHVVFCISKALVLRQYGTEQLLRALAVLLSHEKFGIGAARGFGAIFSSHSFLSKDWGANIRLLAKQKAFMFCISILGEKIKICHGAVKANHLTALCVVLKHAEFPLVFPHLDQLLPLLLQSLDLKDEEARSASIDILATVAQEKPDLLEIHIKSLITRLLSASSNHEHIDLVSLSSKAYSLDRANILIVECTPQSAALPVYISEPPKAYQPYPLFDGSRSRIGFSIRRSEKNGTKRSCDLSADLVKVGRCRR